MAERMIRIFGMTRAQGECRSCHALGTWAVTFPNSKHILLDGDPVALKTEHHNDHGTIEYVALSAVHFGNCPDRDKWRKPR